MRVSSLHLYPVKSTAAIDVTSAQVEMSGLRDDRRWAVIDASGHRLNASRHDGLLAAAATPHGDGSIVLSAPGRDTVRVPQPTGGLTIDVDVSRLPTMIDAGEPAARWFSALLGQPVRLAWQDDPERREISSSHGGLGGEPLNLADTGPLLVTTRASLAQLDAWIAADHEPQPMAMARFRPNLVVEGDEGEELDPFAEDRWRTIRVGSVEMRFTETCDRCSVTTIDPTTLAHGKEPIRTLARHRRWDRKTWFGIRVAPLAAGTVSVGDDVVVMSRA